MKYLVVDAGSKNFIVEAESVEETGENPSRVRFYSDSDKTNLVASFLAPSSWGPAPPENESPQD